MDKIKKEINRAWNVPSEKHQLNTLITSIGKISILVGNRADFLDQLKQFLLEYIRNK